MFKVGDLVKAKLRGVIDEDNLGVVRAFSSMHSEYVLVDFFRGLRVGGHNGKEASKVDVSKDIPDNTGWFFNVEDLEHVEVDCLEFCGFRVGDRVEVTVSDVSHETKVTGTVVAINPNDILPIGVRYDLKCKINKEFARGASMGLDERFWEQGVWDLPSVLKVISPIVEKKQIDVEKTESIKTKYTETENACIEQIRKLIKEYRYV